MSATGLDRLQIRQHFSSHADDYDRYAIVQKKVASELVEMAVTAPVSGSALDIGTGTGAVGASLQACCPEISLTVSDLAHGMTSAARCNLPDVFAIDADARCLPFKSEAFDLVLSASVYQWVEDLKSAFQDCYRILKPGGRFAFALFSDGTLCELEAVFRRALQQSGSERSYQYFQTFPAESVVQEAMTAAGFCQIESVVRCEAEYHDCFRDLLVGLKKIGAQNATTNRPTGLFPRRVMLEMDRLYRHHYQSRKGLCATYNVLYGIGQKL